MERLRFNPASRRVLVAQDEADGLAERLTRGGYQVTACRPDEAEEATGRVRPHLILLDAPHDGEEQVIRRVRARAGGARLLALAGWEAFVTDTAAAGCDGQLVPPVGVEVVDCLLATTRPEGDECGCS